MADVDSNANELDINAAYVASTARGDGYNIAGDVQSTYDGYADTSKPTSGVSRATLNAITPPRIVVQQQGTPVIVWVLLIGLTGGMIYMWAR